MSSSTQTRSRPRINYATVKGLQVSVKKLFKGAGLERIVSALDDLTSGKSPRVAEILDRETNKVESEVPCPYLQWEKVEGRSCTYALRLPSSEFLGELRTPSGPLENLPLLLEVDLRFESLSITAEVPGQTNLRVVEGQEKTVVRHANLAINHVLSVAMAKFFRDKYEKGGQQNLMVIKRKVKQTVQNLPSERQRNLAVQRLQMKARQNIQIS